MVAAIPESPYAGLVPPKLEDEQQQREWERKQRLREYRVASRREKRTRKADEKKQRKLNATILRRMTKNPQKYNKNAERNRRRDIEGERRRIWNEAVRQAQRLALIHDRTGELFNVGPVTTLEDGSVISVEVLEKRKEREAEREAERNAEKGDQKVQEDMVQKMDIDSTEPATEAAPEGLPNSQGSHGMNPERLALLNRNQPVASQAAGGIKFPVGMSKTQQRKLEALAPRPPPPKPVIPDHISLPEGEENWLALWDLSDAELERRVVREKKEKAMARKELRLKQKSGKVERREARDERRQVYRDMKQEWKGIKEIEKEYKRMVTRIEEEESKKIAVEVNTRERKAALALCAELGFTMENTPGVDEIKPKALGMRGVEVDFDKLELDKETSGLKVKATDAKIEPKIKRSNRVDLGAVRDESKARYFPAGGSQRQGDPGEFIGFEDTKDAPQDFESLNFNHKLRRKLLRAIEMAEVKKEELVRQRAIDHLTENGKEVPPILQTPAKSKSKKGRRILEDGRLETDKQERVRTRLELAEYNLHAKILRRQAKEIATIAGLRKYAEATGRIPVAKPAERAEEGEDSDETDEME